MRPTKIDYPTIEKEYVTGEESLRELARRHSCAWASLSAKARRDSWQDKRAAFRDSVVRRSYERSADRFASEITEIRNEEILAMRATVRRYIEMLRDKEISVNTKDAVAAVQTLQLLLGEPTARSENKVIEFSTGGLAPDDLRRLVEFARTRIVEGRLATGPERSDEVAVPG
jgi:transposase-like protein